MSSKISEKDKKIWEEFLSNNQKLIYNDIRKFGFIKFINRLDLDQNIHLKHLGPEPLSTKFNIGYFKNYIKGKENFLLQIIVSVENRIQIVVSMRTVFSYR